MSTLPPAAQARILAAKERVVNRDTNPLLATLPEKFVSFRPHQVAAIREIVDAFDSVDVVLLDAPTGSGKTVIGETVRRLLKKKAIYTCSSKSLQDQFVNDFPYAKVLKGRSNYPTERYPKRYLVGQEWKDEHLSAADCNWTRDKLRCDWCSSKGRCPYEVAKKSALGAAVAVLNTSYWLTETNGPGRFTQNDHDLVIFDEADTLESNLMGFVSVEIADRRMKKYGWEPPEKVTVPSSWIDWCDEMVIAVSGEIGKIPEFTTDVKAERERRYLVGLYEKIHFVRAGLDEEGNSWVYTGKKRGESYIDVSFKPSRVDAFGKELVWGNGKKFLLMSATMISGQEMMESLGYDRDWSMVRMSNTFPVKNRKVVFDPAANMSRKGGQESRDKLVEKVREILDRHPTERVLIHSVSYDLTKGIVDGLKECDRPVFSYTNASGRDQALAEYSKTVGSVLVAPSMERGIDLPGDLCRVQIIAKVPFPYLGDRQVNARLYSKGGQVWYSVQAIRALVQMSGRAIRSETDWAATYILDSQFREQLWFKGNGRGLFPRWFVEAIEWPRTVR